MNPDDRDRIPPEAQLRAMTPQERASIEFDPASPEAPASHDQQGHTPLSKVKVFGQKISCRLNMEARSRLTPEGTVERGPWWESWERVIRASSLEDARTISWENFQELEEGFGWVPRGEILEATYRLWQLDPALGLGTDDALATAIAEAEKLGDPVEEWSGGWEDHCDDFTRMIHTAGG